MSQHGPRRPPLPRVLLTGRPGSGKTTAIRRTIERVGTARCAGFYTEEVRWGGARVGFDVVALSGERAPLARVGLRGPRVGRYGVDVPCFEEVGVAALQAGLARPGELLVIDEIGKMELFSERFVALVREVFDAASPHPVLGAIMRGGHPLSDEIRRRSGVSVYEVTAANRDALPARLARMFSED